MSLNIGIVGFGVVGKSVLRFFRKRSQGPLYVWDKKAPRGMSLEDFLKKHDKIIVSPGVDVRAYNKYKHKFVSELDLFASNFTKKTIAITGTLGKTTVTKLISSLLKDKNEFAGNIGFPMLDLIDEQENIDYAVLELSSFQLEQNKSFAPDMAVWTNFYPNHLDRHTTTKDYFEAKWRLFENQNKDQHAFFSKGLLEGEYGDWLNEKLQGYSGNYSFISCDTDDMPKEGFAQNWALALAVIKCCGQADNSSLKGAKIFQSEHRLELFATINNIDFYNDSKATVMQATMAAINKLESNNRQIILILGGLSKGVDRTPLVNFISKSKLIKKVFYLGNGREEFSNYNNYSSLNDLVRVIMQSASPGDQVLFSPSGSSFDMFSNYKERGDTFKKTVRLYGYASP